MTYKTDGQCEQLTESKPHTDSLLEIRRQIGQSPAMRLAAYPFMNAYYWAKDKQYQQSADKSFIRSLKDTKAGQTCAIIGNGPSLNVTDLELLFGIDSFASNRIYKLFGDTCWRPTYYVVSDRAVLEQEAPTLAALKLPCIILDKIAESKCNPRNPSVHFMNVDRFFSLKRYSIDNVYYSDDVSTRICGGYTVSYVMMQLAIYMGYSTMLLIGMDHSFSHIIDSRRNLTVRDEVKGHYSTKSGEEYNSGFFNYQFLEGVEYAYALARKEAERRGREIVNATRGGSLEVFDRVDFDSYIREVKDNAR